MSKPVISRGDDRLLPEQSDERDVREDRLNVVESGDGGDEAM